jgi:hypothetical protein
MRHARPVRLRALWGLVWSSTLLAWPAAARADDAETARALFEQGVAEMKAGRFRAGCPSVAESYKLDPRPGTLFTLAQCDVERGHIASATAKYEEYLALVAKMPPEQKTKHAKRAADAAADMRAIAPKIPKLTIILPENAPKEMIVKVDGKVVPPEKVGTALPVDLGEHIVSSQLPGASAFEVRVELAAAEQKYVDLAGKAPRPEPKAPEVKAAAPPVEEPEPEPVEKPLSEEEARAARREQRLASIALGSAAGGFLLMGAITGGLTFAQKGAINANCRAYSTFCFQQGVDAANRAKRLAVASDVGFVGGGLLGVAALIAFLSPLPARSPARSANAGLEGWSLSVGPATATVGIRGSF